MEGSKIRSGLAPSWVQHHDDASGHEYYLNDRSGESRWDRPERSYNRRTSFDQQKFKSPTANAGASIMASPQQQYIDSSVAAAAAESSAIPVGLTGNQRALPPERNPFVLPTVLAATSKPKERRASFNSGQANRFTTVGINYGKKSAVESSARVAGKFERNSASLAGNRPAEQQAEARRANVAFQPREKKIAAPRSDYGGQQDALESMMKGNFFGGGCGCGVSGC